LFIGPFPRLVLRMSVEGFARPSAAIDPMTRN
jgi:hypothetical protein